MNSNLPMNRWYASRWVFAANVHQFSDAVANLKWDVEDMTGLKFSLSVAFYKAAAGRQEDEKPNVLQKEVTSLSEIYKHWNKAAYVEARLTPPHEEGMMPSPYQSVTVSAKWPDERRITFHVETNDPMDEEGHIAPLRERVLNRLLLWERGLDFNR